MILHNIVLAATEAAAETASEAAKGNVLETLGINWKLFIAQLINFSIVLFIFWKWVVKPLGSTLTKRQEKIEEGLKNADRMTEEKTKFDEWKTNEMKKVRVEADTIIRTTTDTAGKIKQETIIEAQNQATMMIEQAKATIESEKEKMLKEVKQEVATLVVAASEKILKEKLDPKKDQELINESIKNIR